MGDLYMWLKTAKIFDKLYYTQINKLIIVLR